MGRTDQYPSATQTAGIALGYAEVTANQTGITTLADLTGLSVTVANLPAGRRIRVTGFAFTQRSSAADGETNLVIREGATNLQYGSIRQTTTLTNESILTSVILTPSAGSHTYKLSMERGGTGNIQMSANPSYPAYILVEDITGGQGAPSSSIAYSDYTPTLTQSAAVTKTVTRARYAQNGKQVHVIVSLDVTGTGSANNVVTVSLPVAAVLAAAGYDTIGVGRIYDASAGAVYRGMVVCVDANTIRIEGASSTVANGLGAASTPFTAALASGDAVIFSATYEAA